MSYNKKNAEERIGKAIEQTSNVDVQDLTSIGQLASIGQAQAWRVDGVHAYVEILNTPDLLDTDQTETERSHRRMLRFLHIYQRVAHLVFADTSAQVVDYQNQRLHFLVAEPFGDEVKRITTAVAIADVLRQVLQGASNQHNELPDARIRVGIDTGRALAVRNGTRGDREPLFLGNPANHAAKLLGGATQGIFLTNDARGRLNSGWLVSDPHATALTSEQVKACLTHAGLGLDVAVLIAHWQAEVKAIPLSSFALSRPRPPLSALPLDDLTPANSRRTETAVIYADIDGFTRYVAARVTSRFGEQAAVQALHVIRRELRDVLFDFGGRKIRYNGDCLVGVLAEGADETDRALTLSRATLCAAAMRSSFELIRDKLWDTSGLGLAIGLDAGPVSITRLGPKSSRHRCIVGRAVVEAEGIQQKCTGTQTGLAAAGHAWASPAVQRLLPKATPVENITYNRVHATLDGKGDVAVGSAAAASLIDSVRPKAFGS